MAALTIKLQGHALGIEPPLAAASARSRPNNRTTVARRYIDTFLLVPQADADGAESFD